MIPLNNVKCFLLSCKPKKKSIFNKMFQFDFLWGRKECVCVCGGGGGGGGGYGVGVSGRGSKYYTVI